MNPFCLLVAGALFLTTSRLPAATFDVLSIYVNTDPTDDVSARFDFTAARATFALKAGE